MHSVLVHLAKLVFKYNMLLLRKFNIVLQKGMQFGHDPAFLRHFWKNLKPSQ